MGHQFGADHTFNGTDGDCAGNRSSGTAYEPGSGSTIMGYAGICGSDDLQINSNDYFHSGSFDEVRAFIESGDANTAATITPTGNSVPTVNGGADYTIPAQTPFTLTATGSDLDGDTLTYNWEQRDLGPAQALGAPDNGESPLFRSFSPTTDPSRTFPQISDILGNTTTEGEQLPTTNRELNFRVIARDNRAGGGAISTDDVKLTVVNTGSPFQVTSNYDSANLNGGTEQTITWDVAGTNGNGINASSVNILLSNDGGNTFNTILESNTPNDGSEVISLPNNITTSSARLKVEAVDNIFFDISDNDFSITPQANPTVSLSLENSPLAEDGGVATVTATLDAATTENVTVDLAYDGTADNSDYTAATSITITAGQTTGSVDLTGVDDSLVEGNETIVVDIDNVTNALESGTQQVTATITDDDSNGTSGNDSLDGDDNDNTLNGEGGRDRLYGRGGNDNIDGGADNDFIRSGDDNDTVTGGDDRDIIYGEENDDILIGGLDADILVGGNGNDTLSGGTFNPTTNIGNGTDNSQNRLRGDSGSDVFILRADNTGDIIYDFENDIDKLCLSGGLSYGDLDISDDGSSTTIALSGGDTLATLLSVSDSTQIQNDFITL